MKQPVCLILAALLCAVLPGCGSAYDHFYGIPGGYTASEEHFEKDAWQDSADYCKYVYPSPEPFEKDGRYSVVTEADVAEIRGYFADFAEWMETQDRMAEYDFDDSIIGVGDRVYLRTRGSHDKYEDYTVCFFDSETCVLYYIHANI